MSQSRRLFLKALTASPFAYALAKGASVKKPIETNAQVIPAKTVTNPGSFKPGSLSIIQGPTSVSETLINILAPRLKKYTYQIIAPDGSEPKLEAYESVTGPAFYKVDKIRISDLKANTKYKLRVVDRFRSTETIVDERVFSTLDTGLKKPKFALLSCMSDDRRFNDVIDPMWERLRKQNPDFLILGGDIVYVDTFEFVERNEATELEIWQRYIDTLRRLPLYHWLELKPIFATWDDHDFGTNDGDRDFKSKSASLRIFNALFGGKDVSSWQKGPNGVSSTLSAFDQRFVFMDDRFFKQPNKNQTEQELYGQWGQPQHEWLFSQLNAENKPTWIINGGQFFNGKALGFKEVFEANHPRHFVKFIDDLKAIPSAVVFASGDIHFSEIMKIPKERIGYETYELTSSSMHSYVGDGWDNPMRMEGALSREFNFMIIEPTVTSQGLDINVQSIGLAKKPYFQKRLRVNKS